MRTGDKVRLKRDVEVYMPDAKGRRCYKGTVCAGDVGVIVEVGRDELCIVEIRGGYQIVVRLDNLERV